jgi:hypothetical protein
MKDFDKLFPSMTKDISSKPNDLLLSEREGYTLLFNERAISNYCLDKKRVREIIDKLSYTEFEGMCIRNAPISKKELLKELNL